MTNHAQDILNQDISLIRSRLAEIIKSKSLKIAPPDKPFILTSGQTSTYYIDGKQTTGDPEGVFCMARLILDEIEGDRVEAVGGPTLGADPIVGAVALLSHLYDTPKPLFIVRKEAKQHGTFERIAGPDITGKRVVVVEDVITTGGSALKAIEAIREKQCEIVKVITLVDREQGGREAFEQAGLTYVPLFSIHELLPKP